MSNEAHPVLGNLEKGLLFVISAPAGTGKTTLARMICKEFNCVVRSVSYTTRPIRKGEIAGRDYHFIDTDQFKKKIQSEEFLEYALVFGHFYGTSRALVEKEQHLGRHVLLVIDTEGASQLMEKIPAIFVFISPPNLDELKNRLSQRGSESYLRQKERISSAQREIESARLYDYCIVNDRLEVAYDVLRSILIAEEHRALNKA